VEEQFDWSSVVILLLSATSLGTRLVRWLRDHAAIIQVLADVFEYLTTFDNLGPGVMNKAVKNRVQSSAEERGVGDKFEDLAAASETHIHGEHKSAGKRRRVQKFRKLLGEAKRWLPIIGLFA
jgi:hypothetical protein